MGKISSNNHIRLADCFRFNALKLVNCPPLENLYIRTLLSFSMVQGAYEFGKIKFPEFSRFSRPSKHSFPDNYKVKTRCNKSP